MLCDGEGVPLLVQELEYRDMEFVATFFNGKSRKFFAGDILPLFNIFRAPNRIQMQEAESVITEHMESQWKQVFPHLRLIK